MDWRGAIQVVLREASAPMHYTEIAQQIAERGLRKDDELGATPASTVVAIIVGSLKNDGTNSPFVRTARGYYGLRTEEQVENIEEDLPEATSSQIRGVINAFGMFWERSKVQWESRPRILGQQQAGATPVDFCDQKGVYLLHDAQGVVYVGRVTDQNLGRRLFQHVLDRLSGRWTRFSWFGVYPVSDKGTLELYHTKRRSFIRSVCQVPYRSVELDQQKIQQSGGG
jgi:HB1/ASXL restriction endonuclease-like protein with HTH domain